MFMVRIESDHCQEQDGGSMKTLSILICVALIIPLSSGAADEEPRQYFDGVQARNVGPFRGGRATVAVGVHQDPHVYYMGATGGVWKTTNAGATWQVVSDDAYRGPHPVQNDINH